MNKETMSQYTLVGKTVKRYKATIFSWTCIQGELLDGLWQAV